MYVQHTYRFSCRFLSFNEEVGGKKKKRKGERRILAAGTSLFLYLLLPATDDSCSVNASWIGTNYSTAPRKYCTSMDYSRCDNLCEGSITSDPETWCDSGYTGVRSCVDPAWSRWAVHPSNADWRCRSRYCYCCCCCYWQNWWRACGVDRRAAATSTATLWLAMAMADCSTSPRYRPYRCYSVPVWWVSERLMV